MLAVVLGVGAGGAVGILLADDGALLDRVRASRDVARSDVTTLRSSLAAEQTARGQAKSDVTQARSSASRAAEEASVSAQAGAEANQSRSGELDQREEAVAARESAVATVEQEAAADSFGEGLFVVGDDIRPGRYRSVGGDGCYRERLSGLSGDLDDIISNDIGDGPTVVDISPSDVAFSSSRCGTWTRQP